MSTLERNTHFQGSAQQVAYKILDLAPGALSVYSRDDQKLIAEIIAQYAYDLVYHALYCNGIDARYWPGKPEQASDYYKRQITKATNDVPDLTEWPPS